MWSRPLQNHIRLNLLIGMTVKEHLYYKMDQKLFHHFHLKIGHTTGLRSLNQKFDGPTNWLIQ